MATSKNGGGILAVLLLLLFLKKKSKNTIIIEPYEPTKSSDADYLVSIKNNAPFYNLQKDTIKGYASSTGTLKLDAFNTNELPMWLKVRKNRAFYYIKQGDFTIL